MVLFGKSRMWPIDAVTEYPLPRYRSIVRALAGDSTITSRPFDFGEARLALLAGFLVVRFFDPPGRGLGICAVVSDGGSWTLLAGFLVDRVPEPPVLDVGIRGISIQYSINGTKDWR